MNTRASIMLASLTLAGLTSSVAQPNGPPYGWIRQVRGQGTADSARAAGMDALGNIYVVGVLSGPTTIGTSVLTDQGVGDDLFLAKYDSMGQVLWARHVTRTGKTDGTVALAVDSVGNAYVTSEFTLTNISFGSITLTNTDSSGNPDMLVVKYSSAGIPQWARAGVGISYQRGTGVAVDGAGNCYVAGAHGNVATFDGVSTPITTPTTAGNFLVKYTSAGQVVWVQNVAAMNPNPVALAADGSGVCYLTGSFDNPANFGSTNLTGMGGDFFLAKYDASGQFQWVRASSGAGASGRGVALGPDGSVYVAGDFRYDINFGPGTATLDPLHGAILLVKYDSAGVFQWVRMADGTSDAEYGNAIAVDRLGNCYLTGQFNLKVQFGPVSVTNVLNGDFYVAKYDSAGQFQWVQVGGGRGPDTGFGVVVDAFGYVYATLTLRSEGTFGSTTVTCTQGAGDNDVLLVKLDSGTLPPALDYTIAMYAGIRIEGTPGTAVQVQYVNALGDTNNWLPMATFPLTNNPHIFIDYDSPNQPKRFYRVLPLP
jgi:hypothetical protein